MDATITIAILGASISVVGWIVNYILSTLAERNRQRLLTQIEFTKQQLEELYGPLVFLVMEGNHSFSEALRTLEAVYSTDTTLDFAPENNPSRSQTDENIASNSVPFEKDDEVWKYWIQNEFIPRNERIKSLIANKTHLIEGAQMPQSWLNFIEHHNSWRIKLELWQKGLVEYPRYSRTAWPRDFNDDVLSTFKLLKERQAYLLGIIVGQSGKKMPIRVTHSP
jgi:hypothetical protein